MRGSLANPRGGPLPGARAAFVDLVGTAPGVRGAYGVPLDTDPGAGVGSSRGREPRCIRLVPFPTMRALRAFRLAVPLTLLLTGCASHSQRLAPPAPSTSSTTPEPGDPDPAVELEIAHLRALRAQGTPADQARAAFELAELCVEQAGHIDEARFLLEESRGSVARPQPQLDQRDLERLTRQTTLFERAAQSYADVLRSTDPVAVELHPQARHMLAYVQSRQGQRDAMLATLREQVIAHPSHPLASTAWLMLADAAFEDQRFDDARQQYEQVIRLDAPNHDHLYARYKLGWLAFNGDDAATALEHWARVARGASGDLVQRSLAEAAMKDCVRAYARVGRPEAARAFFLQVAPAHAPELLRQLAQHYLDDGRPQDAARLGVPLPPS